MTLPDSRLPSREVFLFSGEIIFLNNRHFALREVFSANPQKPSRPNL